MTDAAPRPFSDDPVEDLDDDLLNRGPFVGTMASMLDEAAAAKFSTVFSLVGAWGSGKSSILSFLKSRLAVSPVQWDIVEFNPWAYADETSMQLGFFRELQAVLPGKGRFKKAKKAVGQLSTSVAPIAGVVGGLVKVDGEAIAKTLGSVLTSTETTSKAYTQAKKALADNPRSVLLILDDLDRLDPGELVLVAKLVRLVGRLPNVFYVLCYDEETLIDVLTRTPLVGRNEARAKEYLEKIIQIRFDIPPLRHATAEKLVNERLSDVVDRVQATVSAKDQARFADLYTSVLGPRLRTLRSINRFFAQLATFTPTLAAEVNTIDFVLVTWLRVAEPKLYRTLFQQKDWALGGSLSTMTMMSLFEKVTTQDRREALFDRIRQAGVATDQVEPISRLLSELFPALMADLNEDSQRWGAVDDDARGKRIGHPDFFNRYFAFEVPTDDIADSTIDAGLAALEEDEDDSRLHSLERALFEQTDLVVRKITLRNPRPMPLIRWFVNVYDQLPADQTWTASPRHSVDAGIRSALVRLPLDEFDAAVRELTRTRAGVDHLVEFGRNLQTNGTGLALAHRVPKELLMGMWDHLGPILIPHLQSRLDANTPESPFDGDPDYWENLWLWGGLDKKTARDWLRQQIADGRWTLLDELASFVQRGVGSDQPDVVTLGTLEIADVHMFFDIDLVLSDLADVLQSEPFVESTRFDQRDTPKARRDIALNELRREVARRDEWKATGLSD